jgi:hypothetical protein
MNPWYKSVKLWLALFAQLSTILLVFLPALGVPVVTVDLITQVIGLVSQIVALILIALWGDDRGYKRALQ